MWENDGASSSEGGHFEGGESALGLALPEAFSSCAPRSTRHRSPPRILGSQHSPPLHTNSHTHTHAARAPLPVLVLVMRTALTALRWHARSPQDPLARVQCLLRPRGDPPQVLSPPPPGLQGSVTFCIFVTRDSISSRRSRGLLRFRERKQASESRTPRAPRWRPRRERIWRRTTFPLRPTSLRARTAATSSSP